MPSAEPARLRLRFAQEATHCPGCASSRLVLLDVFKVPRDAKGRRVAFATACRDCGILFANPLPTDAELCSHYSAGGDGTYAAARRRIATRQASEMPPPVRDERTLVLDLLSPHVAVRQPQPGAKVLDFGCGDGKYLDVLQDAGWKTYGIEPSADAAFSRHARLEAAPQDRTFDFAMLHHVLEHVPRPLSVLREIAGALRDGAALFVSVPRLDTLSEHGDFKYCLDGRNHVVAFTEASLRHLLAQAGFADAVVIESPALDAMLTGGKRLRLRMIARRGSAVAAVAAEPYRDVSRTLDRYQRSRHGLLWYVQRMVPVRTRGALLDRAIERRAAERRRART